MAGQHKETLKYLSINTFILGMVLIAWAGHKTEDELTIALRFKTMSLPLYLPHQPSSLSPCSICF